MKVFISWSGARSRAVAEALSDWLKQVIQAVKPFYSPDIEKGVKWSGEIDNALEGTKFGIVCLTPDNLSSTWIHYETGALSKTKDTKIWTFLHGLNYSQVPQPLGKFQHTLAEKSDVFKLLKSINSALSEVGGESLPEPFLEKMFNLLWESLEERLKAAEALQPVESDGTAVIEQKRDNTDVLNEILEIVRDQQRQVNLLDQKVSSQQLRQNYDKTNSIHAQQQVDKKYYQLKIIITGKTKSSDIEKEIEKAFNEGLPVHSNFSILEEEDKYLVIVNFWDPLSMDECKRIKKDVEISLLWEELSSDWSASPITQPL